MKKIYLPTLLVISLFFFTARVYAQLSVTATSTNVTCYGSANGTASAVGTGGTAPYTYSWNPAPGSGQGTANVSKLSPGTYTVTYTDNLSAFNSTTVTITQPAQVTSTNSSTPTSCYQGADGTATVSPSGGTPPYTYSWNSNGCTNATSVGLSPGSYTCFINDVNGCFSVPETLSVAQPTALSAGVTTTTNVTCPNGQNGAMLASPAGGTAPYTYSWMVIGGFTASKSGFPAGTYTCQVTDGNGCMTTGTTTVTQPPAFNLSLSSMPSSCGGSTGYTNASLTGGTTPYTYTWSPGTCTSTSYLSLAAGLYTCSVADVNGCSTSSTVAVNNSGAPTITESQVNVLCYGASTGRDTVKPTGGTTPYTYSWSNGATTQTVTGLAAGSFTVKVTDQVGCSQFDLVNITQPSTALTITGTITNVSCNGGVNGAVQLASNEGGTAPYNYSWNPGGSTAAIASGLAAGTYTSYVTDANGCVTINPYTINQPSAITTSYTAVTPSCSGGSNGSATITTSGGTPGYQYSWNIKNGTAPTLLNLSAGTYNCTITDNLGCTTNSSVVVNNPPAIVGTPTSTNVSCYGGSNGTASVTASGGTGTLAYSWSPSGATTTGINSLTGGTYACTITDANGCQAVENAVVNSPAAPVTITPNQSNVSCAGYANGSANASVSGGSPPYLYSWAPLSNSTASMNSLAAGTYTCTVTDGAGCTSSHIYSITVPAAIVISMSQSSTTCFGSCNGSVTVNATGGTGAYSYAWSPGEPNSSSLVNVCAGAYTVQVTDQTGCYDTASVHVVQPAQLNATANPTNVNCNGASNGSGTFAPSGGTSPYTYNWTPSGGTANTASNLAPGKYYCMITDVNNCSLKDSLTITQPAVLNVALSGQNASCGNACDGQAFPSTTGGTLPYNYSWSSGQTTPSLTAICPGTYTVNVKDANGCAASNQGTITTGNSPIITGTVTAPVSGTINSGWAYLVRYDTILHKLLLIDSSAISAGRYTMNNSIGSKYLIYVIPDHTAYPNTVKTYAADTDQWTGAQVVMAACGTKDTANIKVIEIAPPTGSASMSGYVFQGAGYVSRYNGTVPIIQSPGDPVPGLDVNLEQHPGGIIEHQTTDGTGFYHFTHVPKGSFEVFVDVPGLGMVSQYSRTVATGTEMFPNLNYKIDSAHIRPDSVLITGISSPAGTPDGNNPSLSPNPFRDKLTIRYTLPSDCKVIFEIFNTLGEKVALLPGTNQGAGDYLYQLNASDYGLSQGVYTLRMTLGDQIYNNRIIHIN